MHSRRKSVCAIPFLRRGRKPDTMSRSPAASAAAGRQEESTRSASNGKKAIRIPTSALLQDENSAYVLRSIGNNRFIKQPVTTGNDENGETIVFKGLTANDSIVVAGAFYLLDIK